jgi:phospholipase/carboxylesterase
MTIIRLLPPHGIAPQALILVLHGVGAYAESMMPLAQHLHRGNPEAAIVIPDGPLPFDLGAGGYQWFSIKGVTDDNRQARITEAKPKVETIIKQELVHYQLSHQKLGICGFSQGAMMALAMADSPNAPAATVSIAGRIARPVTPTAGRTSSVMLTHGTADSIVPFTCMEEAESAFVAAGYPVQTLPVAGHGHQISGAQARRTSEFFARILPSARIEQAA